MLVRKKLQKAATRGSNLQAKNFIIFDWFLCGQIEVQRATGRKKIADERGKKGEGKKKGLYLSWCLTFQFLTRKNEGQKSNIVSVNYRPLLKIFFGIFDVLRIRKT